MQALFLFWKGNNNMQSKNINAIFERNRKSIIAYLLIITMVVAMVVPLSMLNVNAEENSKTGELYDENTMYGDYLGDKITDQEEWSRLVSNGFMSEDGYILLDLTKNLSYNPPGGISTLATGDYIYLNLGAVINYFGWTTNAFETTSAYWGTRSAYCLEPSRQTPGAGTYEIEAYFGGYAGDNPMYAGSPEALRYIIYYMALDGPGRAVFERDFGSLCAQIGTPYSRENEIGLVHVLLSYINGVADVSAFSGLTNAQIEALRTFVHGPFWYDWLVYDSELPTNDYFRVYYFNSSTNAQDMLSWGYVEPPKKGKLDLQKISANPDITDDNACYSLESAVYGIYNSENTEVDRLVTDTSGYAESSLLKQGAYKVKEITPPQGYALDGNTYEATIFPDTTTRINGNTVSDLPTGDPIHAIVQKLDAETGESSPLGGATLEGAQFTIKYYDGQYSTSDLNWISTEDPVRTWVIETNELGIAFLENEFLVEGSDSLYYSSQGNPMIPIGTITAQETKAPAGYLIDDTIKAQNITSDGDFLEHTHVINQYEMPDSVIRGDLRFNKIEDGTNKRMANIPFSITSKTTGEEHIIVTDKNGNANTSSDWNKHSYNTNEGKTDKDGVWFGTDDVNDELGALPYDSYIINELVCDSNKGKKLLHDIDIVIERDMVTISMGTLTNDNEDEIYLYTTATDGSDLDNIILANDEAHIIDTVTYFNIKDLNEEYIIRGILMDKSTGEPLIIDGAEVISEVKFVPTKSNGAVDVEFKFDASSLNGRQLVVFESLYKGDEEIAEHKDIEDEGQTIDIAKIEIGTTAIDKASEGHEAVETSEVTIIDDVSYKGLTPGKLYTLKGILMDKYTEESLKIDGMEITSEVKFTPSKADGSVKVEFTFDATGLSGKEMVVFETLYLDEKEIATHTDISDEGQTVKIVKTIPNAPKSAFLPQTGDNSFPFLALIGLIVAVLIFLFIMQRKKRKKK